MVFCNIQIPPEHHPTRAASASLSQRFGFQDNPEIQDWERHFQDFGRLLEFVGAYNNGEIDDEEKFLLMELILASATEAEPAFFASPLWKNIEELLRANHQIHAWSIWFWSCIDEETWIPYNDFIVSPFMQSILLDVTVDDQENAQSETKSRQENAIRFGKFWWRHFGTCEPVAHRLRSLLNERWVRLHSLPDSKRYPETEWEHREVIRRANILANEVLGPGSKCWLIANRYPNTPSFSPDAAADFGLSACLSWLDHDEPLGPAPLVAHAAIFSWDPHRFEGLLGNIARGEDSMVMWISEETHAVFAPYDGGIDLILPNAEQATATAIKYAEWLSPYPGGT